MPLSVEQYTSLTGTLAAAGLTTITPPQAEAIAGAVGIKVFAAMVRDVRDGKPKGPLSLWCAAARLGTRIAALKIPADLTALHALIGVVERDRLLNTVVDAEGGNVVAKRILTEWIKDPAQASTDGRRAPVHPTTVAPPPSTAATEAPQATAKPSSQQAASVPADASPRQREGQPVQRVDAAAAQQRTVSPGASSSPQRNATVTPLRRPYADGDGDGSADRDATREPTVSSRRFDEVKVFGRDSVGGTAMNFSRSIDNKTGISTINLSIARAKGARTQDGCDWDRRIEMKLTAGEVTRLMAVLIGRAAQARCAGHGERNDKWLSITESKEPYRGTLMVTIAKGDDRRSCSITPDDLVKVISIFSRTMFDQTGASQITQYELIDRHARMNELHEASQAARKSRAS